MSQKQEQKVMIKKSSFQIQDEPQSKQKNEQQEQSKQQTHSNPNDHTVGQKQQGQNLLDLDQETGAKKKEYEKFLENRIVTIQGPELVTENVIKSYKLYKIKSRKKDKQQYDTCVSRRFSDFQYLQKQLIQSYGGCIIPVLPQKNIWANVNMQGQQQIASRVKNLQKYLKSLLSHQRLRKSEELKNFLFQDQVKFSQKKGQFFSKVKTEQKIKYIAANAYSYGKGIISKFINGNGGKQQQAIQIAKPNVEDLKLMEYQRQVTDLIKVIQILKKVVQHSVLQMKTIGLIMPQSKEASFKFDTILSEFEDLCKYIFSCNEALMRRNGVRIEIDQLNTEYESLQKKIKTNPRSQQVDVLRNKLARATQKCQKWTESLLQELHKSISVGKSMVQQFIGSYTGKKQAFYDL